MRIGQEGRRGLVAVLLALVAFLFAATGLGATSAVFSAATSNPANTIATDRLAPPGSLDVTASCAGAAPPIAFRAASTATGTDTLTLPIPAGTVPGDVLVMQVASTKSTVTFTKPTDWTAVRARDANSGYVVAALYVKVAGAAEPDPTFTFPGGTGALLAGGIVAYSGVSTTNPVDASGARPFGNSTTAPLDAFTTPTAGTLVVRMVASAGPAFTAPAGLTGRWHRDGSSGPPRSPGTTAADVQVGGTFVAQHNFTVPSPGTGFVGQWVALKRGPAAPAAQVSWTPTPSAWADGYRLERQDGTAPFVAMATLPGGATSYADGQLAAGTSYTYRLAATSGAWRSAPVTDSVTPTC